MSNSLSHRDPATLVTADLADRRRLAMSELTLIADEGTWSPLAIGQVILKHVTSTDEVLELTKEIERKMRHMH